MSRGRPPTETSRAAALALGMALLGVVLLPLLACALVASSGPDASAGPTLCEESSAALGGVQRLLHGDGCIRLDPWAPEASTALHHAPAAAPDPSRAGEGSTLDLPAAPRGAEPERRL